MLGVRCETSHSNFSFLYKALFVYLPLFSSLSPQSAWPIMFANDNNLTTMVIRVLHIHSIISSSEPFSSFSVQFCFLNFQLENFSLIFYGWRNNWFPMIRNYLNQINDWRTYTFVYQITLQVMYDGGGRRG